MKIEEKSKIFLEKLRQKYQEKFSSFKKFSGPGLKRKIQRLIFAPTFYVSYLFQKVGIIAILGEKPKKAKLFWGKEIYLDMTDSDGFFLGVLGFLPAEAEYKLTKFFIKKLKGNDVFYDVGANYGFYTALASEFCKEVHSFEPLPQIFRYLEMSFKDNSNIFLNNIGFSDKEGETEIFIPAFHSGGSTILKVKANKIGKNINKTIKVKTTTLDNYIASVKSKPTVIKLDVEGAESLIINGGIEFFKNNNPIIAMEVWSKDKGYEISKKAIDKLKNLGYQPYFINSNGEIEKVENELTTMIKKSFENFIFLKN